MQNNTFNIVLRINLWIPLNVENFLTSWGTASFSRM